MAIPDVAAAALKTLTSATAPDEPKGPRAHDGRVMGDEEAAAVGAIQKRQNELAEQMIFSKKNGFEAEQERAEANRKLGIASATARVGIGPNKGDPGVAQVAATGPVMIKA
jgi:hypothetical protein